MRAARPRCGGALRRTGCGWAPGQLDDEIQDNGWLHVPPDEDLIFGTDLDGKWVRVINKLGIDLGLLSATAGRA